MKLSKLFKKIVLVLAGNRFIVLQGGTSAGKSYSTLQLLLVMAMRSNKVKLVSIVAETLPHLKRGVYRDFIKILMEQDLYHEANHNKTDFIYRLGGWTFEFFSADNDGKLRGARRDILFVNECNRITWDAFTQLEIRTRDKVFVDFNPVSNFWVHKKLMPMNKGNFSFIKSNYQDNKDHITEEFLIDDSIVRSIESRKPIYDEANNLISGDENFWKVYGLGEVGSLEGVVFDNWRRCDEIPPVGKWRSFAIDFGFTNDPTCIVEVVYQGGELWVKEHIYETGLTNEDIIKKLHNIGVRLNDEIICDSAEPKSIATIKRAGFRHVRGVKKGPDSITNGIDILKRFKINIHKDSVNTINEFENYLWVKTKDGEMLNKPIDNFNHSIDPIRYVGMEKIGMDRQVRKGIKRRD